MPSSSLDRGQVRLGLKVSGPLMRWYRKHGRDLPWRRSDDPYAIWIAEVMLQQTRVETVRPYYERWLAAFPDVLRLAQAPEQRVLKLWEGLGYYSRARNLLQAAQIVAGEYAGHLPRDVTELRRLPGIGPYTAGAIASIAFGRRASVLDGNVARVLARLFDLRAPIDRPRGRRLLWKLADGCLPARRPGDHNQALMDLGAIICRPKDPDCPACPLRGLCRAAQRRTQHKRPVTSRRRETPSHVHASAVIQQRGRFLLSRRPTNGLLGGLWEFPQVRLNGNSTAGLTRLVRSQYDLRVRPRALLITLRHAYSHFRVVVHAFRCDLISQPVARKMRWVSAAELKALPMGKLDRMIAGRVAARASHP